MHCVLCVRSCVFLWECRRYHQLKRHPLVFIFPALRKEAKEKMPKIVIHYFKFPFWRAEVCRLALHLGKVSILSTWQILSCRLDRIKIAGIALMRQKYALTFCNCIFFASHCKVFELLKCQNSFYIMVNSPFGGLKYADLLCTWEKWVQICNSTNVSFSNSLRLTF